MEEIGIIGFALIITNVYISYRGFKDHAYFDLYSFKIDEIVINKDYKRLITSGFIHVSWIHLLFNMGALYCFSYDVETSLGPLKFLLIYFGSLVGGNLFALFIHKNHYDYSAVGASGAISGIIFASIALFPGIEIGLFGIPYYIPGWAFGLCYVLFSIYGITSQRDNIGHEDHLGGGLIGLLIAIVLVPSVVRYNYLPIALILIPSSAFIYFIISKPEFLLIDNFFKKHESGYTYEDKYNSKKNLKEKELNDLLDKISNKGYKSLSKKEKEKLKEHSR